MLEKFQIIIFFRSKTVSENLKLNSALLSRFDLVFILLDQPDEVTLLKNVCVQKICGLFQNYSYIKLKFQKIDAMLSEHVLALHSRSKSKRKQDGVSQLNAVNSSQPDTDVPLR